MKLNKNKWLWVLSLALLAGCKEDTDISEFSSYAKVYMPQAYNKPAVHDFIMSENEEEIIYGAGLGTPGDNGNDVEVKFKVDPAKVQAFNEENFTSYPMMPEGSYRLEQTSTVIKKGTTTSPVLKLKVKTLDNFDGVGYYILPVSIDQVSGGISVNENLRTTYFLVRAQYESNPFQMYDRSKWTVANFSSDENENASGGRAAHAIDGSNTTFWTTQWRNAKPGPPHHITLNMGETKKIHGIKFRARTDASGNIRTGNHPKDVIIETSVDGTNWTYSESFSLINELESTMYLSYAQDARYFRVTVNSAHNDTYNTNIAEIYAF